MEIQHAHASPHVIARFADATAMARRLARQVEHSVWVKRQSGGWVISLLSPRAEFLSRPGNASRIQPDKRPLPSTPRALPAPAEDWPEEWERDIHPCGMDPEDDPSYASEGFQDEAVEEIWSNMDDFGRDIDSGWAYSDDDSPW